MELYEKEVVDRRWLAMCSWTDSCPHAQILGEPEASVGAMLDLFGVHLKPSELRKDVKPLLKTACSAIFGSATGLVDMLTQHVPSSRAGAVTKVRVCSSQARNWSFHHACGTQPGLATGLKFS